MADTRQSVSVRIGLDGGKKVADDLARIGAQGVKALDSVGAAAGRMSSATRAQAAAIGVVSQAQRQAETDAQKLRRAFAALGVTSEQQADKQRAAVVRAYETIKASGKASLDEVRRAGEAMNRELAKIDGNVRGATDGAGRFEGLRAAVARVRTEIVSLVGAYGALQTGRATVRAAADFENGLVSVGKTADLSGEQLQAFGADIQALGREIPVAHTELLGIAAAAGQLGIKGSDNLLTFTRTVAQMGSATNLAGEQAATVMARLLTVTGEPIANVERLGSAIVALGNNMAATESEIAESAQRVAQAGAVFGLTAQEALGIGAALRAVGVSAELGGSGVGRAMAALNAAVNGTAAARQEMAAALKLTETELQSLFANDPGEVFRRFVGYLNEVQASGGNVAAVLDAVGLSGTENLQVIGALASNYDVLTRALDLSSQAWGENSALTKEAETAAKRYDAQMQMQKNIMNELAIVVGSELMPHILEATQGIAEFVDEGKRTGDIAAFASAVGTAFSAVAEVLKFVVRNYQLVTAAGAAYIALRIYLAARKDGSAFRVLASDIKGAITGLRDLVATRRGAAGLSSTIGSLGRSLRSLAGLRLAAGGIVGALAGVYLATRTSEYDRVLESTNKTVAAAADLQTKLANATGAQAEALAAQRDELVKTQEAEVERLEKSAAIAESRKDAAAWIPRMFREAFESVGFDKLAADGADAYLKFFGAATAGGTATEVENALAVAREGLKEVTAASDEANAAIQADAKETGRVVSEQATQAAAEASIAGMRRAEAMAEINGELVREIELSRMSADERRKVEAADQAVAKIREKLKELGSDLTEEEEAFTRALAERAAAAQNAGQAVTEALSSMKEAHQATRAQFDRGLELRTDGIDRAAEQQRRAIDALEDYDRRTMASAQLVKRTEREKTAAVEGWARGATAAVRQHYGTAIALARAAGEDTTGLQREMLTELEGINRQREEQLRGTVDRLIEEEQRHRDAAVAAAEDAARRIKSIDASVRDLQLSLLSPEAQYKAREGDIAAKKAEAKAALAAGQYEEAKDLADEIAREAVENARSVDGSARERKKAVQIAMAHAEQAKGLIRDATDRITKAEKAAGDLAAKQAAAAGKQLSGVQAQIAAIQKANGAITTMQLRVEVAQAVQGIQAVQSSLDTLKQKAAEAAGSLAAVGATQPSGGAPGAAPAQAAPADDGAMGIVEAAARLDGARQALAAATGAAVAQAQADVAAAQAAYDALANGQTRVQAGMVATGQAVSVASQQVAASTQAAAASSVISLEQIQASSGVTAISMTGAFETAAGAIVSAMTNASTGSQTALGAFVDWAKGALASVMSAIDSAIEAGKRLLGIGGGEAPAVKRAGGGPVFGAGTSTSDSIPAWLSNGEFVVKARAVRAYGLQFLRDLNSMRLPKFAEGGLVSLPMPSFATPAFAGARSIPDGLGGGREQTTPVNLYVDGQKVGTIRAAGDPLADLTRAGRVRVAQPSRHAR